VGILASYKAIGSKDIIVDFNGKAPDIGAYESGRKCRFMVHAIFKGHTNLAAYWLLASTWEGREKGQ
jgi:hypothetical protein